MSELEPTPWKEFFDRHAPHYDANVFAQNTEVEVQFLWEVMKLDEGMTLLDMGCGTGRHALEFAARGLTVTGVDFSPNMLTEARRKASERGLEVEWVNEDGTTWSRIGAFDAAVCLCEGGFGLTDIGQDPVQHDLRLLQSIAASLKPGSPFVMTALNGYSMIRRMTDEHVDHKAFDPATMVLMHLDTMDLPEGPVTMPIQERLFIPPEVAALLHHAGFEVLHIWGGTAGNWGERPLKLDEIEAMYVCRRR